MRGLLISFEGGDNSGKSTQIKLVVEELRKRGYKTVYLSFPNEESEIGSFIYDCLTNGSVKNINNKAFQYLYIADQMNMQSKINDYMEKGYIVILDRYDLSSITYLLATTMLKHEDEIVTSLKGKDEYSILSNKMYLGQSFLIRPDITFIFDISSETMRKRNKLSDENEKNTPLMEQVIILYRFMPFIINDTRKYIPIDANQSKEKVFDDILFNLKINEFEEYIDILYLYRIGGNILEYKIAYSEKEWELRKEYYIQSCSALFIPMEATSTELKALISSTNNVLTQAYMDKASIQEKYERESLKLKNMEEECWCSIDWDQLGNKFIKEEKKAYIIKFIKKKTSSDNGKNLYDKVELLSGRVKFMESTVYNLKEKAGALFNLLSLMKIENEQIKFESSLQ